MEISDDSTLAIDCSDYSNHANRSFNHPLATDSGGRNRPVKSRQLAQYQLIGFSFSIMFGR